MKTRKTLAELTALKTQAKEFLQDYEGFLVVVERLANGRRKVAFFSAKTGKKKGNVSGHYRCTHLVGNLLGLRFTDRDNTSCIVDEAYLENDFSQLLEALAAEGLGHITLTAAVF